MSKSKGIAPVRVLPESVANRIAAGEVVERPASVVKELVENALDAKATKISVRIVGAGRRSIEIADNGHGMSEQDALLAIERHATSKVRKAEDLDNITTLGFRGEALASIAAVSRFELVTRREQDDEATRIQIDGGILRNVGKVGAPVGTRVSVNRLYFNTPARAKFLKGITTELSHCVDAVQRHALAQTKTAFQFLHNEKTLLDVPANSTLRERLALIWGLGYVRDMVEVEGEQAGFILRGLIGTPALTRSTRAHQFFYLNRRPVVNRSLQYGYEDGYQGLLTIGRHPVGVVLIETHPRFVDVNIHPAKREIRFRDERAARDAIRDIVRTTQAALTERPPAPEPSADPPPAPIDEFVQPAERTDRPSSAPSEPIPKRFDPPVAPSPTTSPTPAFPLTGDPPPATPDQPELPMLRLTGESAPQAVYGTVGDLIPEPLQLFETYLLVPEDDRLLIIDQHALHERLNYDNLVADLRDADYEAQQLAVPILLDVPPAHAKLLQSRLALFEDLGMHIEPFGGATFQITAICHLYDEGRVTDAIFRVLDELAQGNLFDRDDFMADFLRLATEACRASVKAGDRLTLEEKQELVDGFRRMRPPYTCPHGRPIITELTLSQMEKSFRRRQ